MANKYITIIDNTGRNVLGIIANETSDSLEILNPVMITVQPQNNQFQVQLIPLFLAEFISPTDKGRNFVFKYNKNNIAVGKDFNIDARITSQYEKIIEASNPAKKAEATPEVIKLFE